MTALPEHLHLGCGLVTPEAWLNVDGSWNARLRKVPVLGRFAKRLSGLGTEFPPNIYGHDLRTPLPWPDRSFTAVYASHLVEHLYHEEARALVRECRRVLRPGGVIRIVVPDLRALVDGYLTGAFPPYIDEHAPTGPNADRFVTGLLMRERTPPRGSAARRLYNAVFDFHSHKWMYDEESMSHLLGEAGFTELRRMGYLESRIPGIDLVERASRVENGAGLVVEGVRP